METVSSTNQMLSCEIRGMNEHLSDQVKRFDSMIPIMRDVIHASHSWKKETVTEHDQASACDPCLDCDLVEQSNLKELLSKQVNFLHIALDSLLQDVESNYSFNVVVCPKVNSLPRTLKRKLCCQVDHESPFDELLSKKVPKTSTPESDGSTTDYEEEQNRQEDSPGSETDYEENDRAIAFQQVYAYTENEDKIQCSEVIPCSQGCGCPCCSNTYDLRRNFV